MTFARCISEALRSGARFGQLPPRTGYTRSELRSDAIVHAVGLVATAAAVPTVIGSAIAWRGDAASVLATTLYSAALAATMVFSALYNVLPPGTWTGLLQRLDHSAIYFKIAGTFTAFGLLSDGTGSGVLVLLWVAAVGGTALRVFAPERGRPLAIGLCLAMGWAGGVAGWATISSLPDPIPSLIVAGGLLYSGGVAFYLFDRLPHHITIWHGFVLAATALVFSAMLLNVAGTPATAALAPTLSGQ